MDINELMKESHRIAVEHGWWGEAAAKFEDGTLRSDRYYDDRNLGEQIALMHSELSEALEEYRDNKPPIYWNETKTGKPEGIVVEFADVLIRIFDTCERYGWDLSEALERKLKYNESRPYRHGNKLA